jgi:hypothetical protein
MRRRRAKVNAHLKAAAESNVAAANFSLGAQTLHSLPGEFRLSACFLSFYQARAA